MTPISFGGCFGWLHLGYGTRGIVLCPAFGHENTVAHRGWRELAEGLASKGFNVLRFDYPGTGDSIGSETDPNRLMAWNESVTAAASCLRSLSTSSEIILVGLKLGGTLALLASASIEGVSGVVCLAPILSGKTYIRELRLRANAWRDSNLHAHGHHSNLYLDVLGDRLSDQTIQDLLQVNLGYLQVVPSNVLIMGSMTGSLGSTVLHRLHSLNCVATVMEFSGVDDYLENSIESVVPYDDFSTVINWCERVLPRSSTAHLAYLSSSEPSGTRSTLIHASRVFTETAVQFGSTVQLFGILCAPSGSDGRTTCPLIMLNTGFGRHVGDGRAFTTLARQLADGGIASLRMDLTNFGDSHLNLEEDPDPYSISGPADVKAAIDFLEQAGYRNPYLIGVCSGAYTAFHTTIQDQRVAGLIVVNIQAFSWKPGSSLKIENRRHRRPLRFYMHALTQPRAWRRLFEKNIRVFDILVALCRRPLVAMYLKLVLVVERTTGLKTLRGQPRRWFNDISSRGIDFHMFYSNDDPGLANLSQYFGKNGRQIRKLKNVRVHVLRDADHALFDHDARHQLIDEVVKIIREKGPSKT